MQKKGNVFESDLCSSWIFVAVAVGLLPFFLVRLRVGAVFLRW